MKMTVMKEFSQFYQQIWELSSENKGLKQEQDHSIEITVNKLPSWVKHEVKNLLGYQGSTFSSK